MSKNSSSWRIPLVPYQESSASSTLKLATAQRDFEVATQELQDTARSVGHSITIMRGLSKQLESAYWSMLSTLPFNPNEEHPGLLTSKESSFFATPGLYKNFVGSTKFWLGPPKFDGFCSV